MAAGTYLFGWINSWKKSDLKKIQLHMAHFRHSRKWTQTRNPNYAYITPCINGGYGAYTATWLATLYPSNFVISKPINFEIGEMIKIHEIYLPCKFGRNRPTRTWVIDVEISSHLFLWEFWLPFSDDVISSVSEATLTPWQENSLFSQCKNRHSRNFEDLLCL